jgi:hypothetical protein
MANQRAAVIASGSSCVGVLVGWPVLAPFYSFSEVEPSLGDFQENGFMPVAGFFRCHQDALCAQVAVACCLVH